MAEGGALGAAHTGGRWSWTLGRGGPMDYGGALGSSSSAGGCRGMAVDGEFVREEVAVGEVSLLTMVTSAGWGRGSPEWVVHGGIDGRRRSSGAARTGG
jgi:hypothetical protein